MRNLIITFLLAIIGISAKAQDYYPLPSTQVYGELVVDSSFVNEFQGYTLSNDSLDLGVAKIPFAGVHKPLGIGYFLNGVSDWSSIGGSADDIRLGYFSLSNLNYIRIDTSEISIRSQGDLSMNSSSDMYIDVANKLSVLADTLVSITDSFALINSTNWLQLSARDDDYNSGWDFGYTAFGVDNPGVAQANCTMYALREDIDLDVNVIYVDSARIKASSLYGVQSVSEFNYNEIEVDSTKILLLYGNDQGGLNPPRPSSVEIKEQGVETIIDGGNMVVTQYFDRFEIESVSGFFYAPRMTGTQAEAIATVEEGAMVYITAASTTFTARGYWVYEVSQWNKVTP